MEAGTYSCSFHVLGMARPIVKKSLPTQHPLLRSAQDQRWRTRATHSGTCFRADLGRRLMGHVYSQTKTSSEGDLCVGSLLCDGCQVLVRSCNSRVEG